MARPTYDSPLSSDLYLDGFKNDITPLDEYTLNLLLAIIDKLNVKTKDELIDKLNTDSILSSDTIVIDGGGVPQSVIDGTNTTWNGEFPETSGGTN